MSQSEKSQLAIILSDRLALASQGVRQSDLSKALGIGQSNVSMYLRGDRVPSLEVFRALCVALNVTSDFLLGLPDSEKKESLLDDSWEDRARHAERKLDKVNEALGKIIEGTKALQEAVK